MDYPNVVSENGNEIQAQRSGEAERKKRDIHLSDELTDEDFRLFKNFVTPVATNRYKRALLDKPTFTKENATLYCMERISNTEAGKLCAKLGANIQAKVNSCAIDLEVKCYIYICICVCWKANAFVVTLCLVTDGCFCMVPLS